MVNGAEVTPAAGRAVPEVLVPMAPSAARVDGPRAASWLDPGARALSPAANASASDSSEARAKRRDGSRSSARKNHASNAGGRPGYGHRRRGHRRGADLHEEIADALALEGQDAGHAFVRDDAERPEVGAVIDVAQAARLLGRHVVGRAEHGARLGAAREPLFARGRLDLRDAEVEHLGDLVVVVRRADEEDVLRLQVAVDDARVVRALQRAADLPDDPRRLLQREACRGARCACRAARRARSSMTM